MKIHDLIVTGHVNPANKCLHAASGIIITHIIQIIINQIQIQT